ncbi:MAG TPA: DUF1207 domain-containing protein [Longimicrobiales bacterium]|nr:DUF1207 domain-containing protein [Longimicrobiales bacterium]
MNSTIAGRLLVLALVTLVVAPARASGQEGFRTRCGAGVHAGEESGFTPLPQGTLFCPFVADPKFEHSFVSYLRGDFATIADSASAPDTNIGAVGLGDSFGLFRISGNNPGNGLQLDLMGAIFAQFNLDRPSFDLINADYLVGLPVTFRTGGFTTRLRLYHQSSHLGDEFILSRQPQRINFSFESIELVLSQEVGPVRVYAGGEHFFRSRPIELVARLAHGGIELRPGSFGAGRLVAAVDVKAVDLDGWDWSTSVRAGVEIARVPSPGHPPRVLSLLGEFYDGASQYGQFYRDNIRFYGLGIHFSL